jgi:hypothetical protein
VLLLVLVLVLLRLLLMLPLCGVVLLLQLPVLLPAQARVAPAMAQGLSGSPG